ncbi:MAG: hypothetical protein AAF599_03560 [Bacteroidota bacterium]
MGVCSPPSNIEEVNVYPTLFDYAGTAYTTENKEDIYRTIIEGWLSE